MTVSNSVTRLWRTKFGATARYLLGAAAAAALMAPAAGLMTSSASAETLRVGVRDLPPGLGNPYTGRGRPSVDVWHAIFDELTMVTVNGDTEGKLATSWKNIDKSTWQFTLRPGVKFSNGETLDAAAVKATYDWLIGDVGKATVMGKDAAKIIASSRVIDDLTIELTTVGPNPITPKQMSFFSIVAPKAWADMGIEEFSKHPVGSGPYKMEEFKPGSAVAVANPGSWVTRADIDRIQILVLPEPGARTAAIISDQIDVDVLTAQDSFPQLESAGVKIFKYAAGRTLGLTIISTKGGPMADVRVRQAANYAVNKQAIIDAVYGGDGIPASQSATSNSFGFNPDVKPYPYDPDKARALLAEAGFPNGGVKMEVQAITSSTDRALVYQSAVQDMNKVGFKAELISQTFPEWLKHWLAGSWPYEAFGFGTDLTGVLDAGRAFNAFVSCKKDPPFYCNEAEMPLVAAQAVEFDVEKRRKILQELLKMNSENAAIIFLTQGFEAIAYQPRITNFDAVNQRLNYAQMKIKK